MIQTRNSLPESTRQKVVDLLQKRLAESIDIILHAKQSHWNIKGLHFVGLHKLFDEIHEKAETFSDLIAERIAQVGGVAEGTREAVLKNSTLPPYSLNLTTEAEHLRDMRNSLAAFEISIYESVHAVEQWKDFVTVDILTEIARGVDQYLWMVESHLPAKADASVRQSAQLQANQ